MSAESRSALLEAIYLIGTTERNVGWLVLPSFSLSMWCDHPLAPLFPGRQHKTPSMSPLSFGGRITRVFQNIHTIRQTMLISLPRRVSTRIPLLRTRTSVIDSPQLMRLATPAENQGDVTCNGLQRIRFARDWPNSRWKYHCSDICRGTSCSRRSFHLVLAPG